LRFSDLQSLSKENIEVTRGKRYLRINLTKQKKYHTIFLPDIALKLWEENNYSFKSIHSQQESENLKLAAKVVKLERKIHSVRYRLQKRIVEVKPISELISTHMARRTFARRWYEKGGDLNLLRDYLGHKSLITTLNYIGLESDEANTEAERLFG
jgi:integrase